MKNFVALLAVLFSVTTLGDWGPTGRSVDLDGTGALKGGEEKFYINVKNVSGGSLSDGDVVILDVTEDDGYSVNSSTTAGAVPHCVLDEACADDELCRCQTYGLKSNVNFTPDQNNAAAGGLAFISESQAGKVDAISSPGAADRPIGVFFDAATATGDVELFIRLR